MKTTKLFSFFALAAMLFFLVSCAGEGRSGNQEPADEGAVAATPAEPVDPVAWNDLQKLIPEKAAGMSKTNTEDDKSSLGNLGFSHALGIYEKDGGKIELQIIDSGNRSVILSTLAPWRNMTSLNMQHPSGGYEKYVTIGKHPGYEAFDDRDKMARLNVLVKGRFIVMLSGRNVAMEDLYKVVKNLDLEKMESM